MLPWGPQRQRKHIFGVIPGLSKPGHHAKLHDVQRFAGMLLDLAHYVTPQLAVPIDQTGLT